MKISLCIITLNEERNLERCLDSCEAVAEEVIILDSGSSDRTERIARGRGAKWQVQEWLGFVAQKNRVIGLAEHPWILSLDADEALSPELRDEILAVKRSGPPGMAAGFSMPRCVWYEGKWIRHGDWYPDRLTRLFLKERGRFAGGRVHERLELTGQVLPLRGDLWHFSFADAEDHWARCRKYARLWAESRHEAGQRAWRWAAHAHAAHRWARGLILKRGFLDGRQGWRIARLCAAETFLKYTLLRELSGAGKRVQGR